MFESQEDIERQLIAREDSFVEFKEVRLFAGGVRSPNNEEMAGELCAFGNAEGGAVFLGVRDNGTVAGIPEGRLQDVEEWVVNIARSRCDPPLLPLIRSAVVPDGQGDRVHILLAEVRRSLHVHTTSGGRWYVRVGSTKRDMSPTELSRLFQERRAFAFDEAVVPTSLADDLDQASLRGRLGVPEDIDWMQLLRNMRILADDGRDNLRPTVAGLLAFGSNPGEHMAGAAIQAAVYRGTQRTSDELTNAQDFGGPVDRQIDGAMRFVERFMLRPARKSAGRVEFPQFDVAAVHEAIVNAVAHRDYSIGGSRTRVFLYSDRLEISSPGGLPNTLTVETMRYRQFTRNQLLVSFLRRFESAHTGRYLLEERGEGVELIIRRSREQSGLEPTYAVHGDEVLLTIWAQQPPLA